MTKYISHLCQSSHLCKGLREVYWSEERNIGVRVSTDSKKMNLKTSISSCKMKTIMPNKKM